MTRNLKTLTMLASAVLLAATLTGCGEDAKTETAAKAAQARTQDLLETIKSRGTITIAMEGTWSPWTYHDKDGKLTGFDVAIGERIAQKIGVKARFIEGKWDGLLAGLDAGCYDLMINGVGITKERSQAYPHAGVLINPFVAAVVVFAVNEGAYCAETIRAALESVPAGQLEAGLCSGMSYLQTITRIVLPQAFRTAFPTLGNSLIAMVKDTSLAANITVTEMFMTTQRIVARTYEPLLLYIEVGLIYLIFCTVLTRLQSYGEKRLRTYVSR